MAMTVLVVDDSVTMVMSLKTTLAMSGFRGGDGQQRPGGAGEVASGNQAQSDSHRHQHAGDGRNGADQKCARAAGLRFVPILTLTTESEAGKRDEGKRAGSDRMAGQAGVGQ